MAATTPVPRPTIRSEAATAECFEQARARVTLALLAIEGIVVAFLAATGLAVYKIAELFG